MPEIPSEEEQRFYNEIVCPLAEQNFYTALVILQKQDGDIPIIAHMGTDTEGALDLIHSALLQVTEERRAEQDNLPEDDGA